MQEDWQYRVARSDIIHFVQQAGQCYWPEGPYPRDPGGEAEIDLRRFGREWCLIDLPDSYAALGVEGTLLVDAASISPGEGTAFERCDWHLAAFAHLSAIAEWQHELAHGPTHSYAIRLDRVPSRLFDHAWSNRILLLLRLQEASALGKPPEAVFGPLPEMRVHITHDVDAIEKTLPIRIKQGLFELFNMLRNLARGKICTSWRHAKGAFAIALRASPYNHLDTIADQVAAKGLRSTFHLHVRKKVPRSPLVWLMDPGYHIDDTRLTRFVAARHPQGFTFGLHPSFTCWKNAAALADSRTAFQQALRITPTCIRQHWLRFSLRDTWRTQTTAGFTLDYTLGFNERTGFRAGAALRYHPWDFVSGTPHTLQICPTMAMDSQFYAYSSMSDAERKKAMADLVDEIKTVHGEIAVLWHPHTLASDYGWKHGFEDLLDLIGTAA